MAAVVRLQSNLIQKRLLNPFWYSTRAISTSKKNRDTATVASPECPTTAPKIKTGNWVSYGFEFKDESADRFATHSIFFMAITVCMVFGGFVWTYIPDFQMRDWAQREAFLELRRRESEGLPLINKNLVDPEMFSLPSESQLNDVEIII